MIGTFFYNIIIAPISDVLEFFYVFFSAVSSKGIAVISLSFVVTLFCLPLYIVAEKWQEEERNVQNAMKGGIKRIKDVFKGDEQYMILNAFYREHKYHPIMALRSSFSLLIQIPFFIAAYSFLSNVESLKGYSFGFIRDFGSPDKTFMLGSLAVNVLPIAMTIINIVAGAIYSKGHGAKEKIQIYAMALIFLVILYNSPSGLVIYWTMNNVLSLVKNIFYKLKNPGKIFYILCVLSLFASIFWAFSTGKRIYEGATIALFALSILFPLAKDAYGRFLSRRITVLDRNKPLRDSLFWFSALAAAFLAGAVLPSFIIESSPSNFCYVDSYKSPFVFIAFPFLQSIGLFVFWPACLYYLFSASLKKSAALFYPIFYLVAIANCFVFAGNYGPMNDDLTFMHEMAFPTLPHILANVLAILAVAAIVLALLARKPRIVRTMILIATISFAAVFVKNVSFLKKTYENMNHEEISDLEPIYHLSRTQKNVLVIMQDRCLSPVLPEVFEENPFLKEKYDGFTFFPNTVALSYYTQLGVPGVFGGYDYTPFELNKRNETIQKKHNEAILSMPTVFGSEGWNVTLTDISYENYGEEPVTQIYDGMENIERHILKGMYTSLWYTAHGKEPYPIRTILLKRNFLYLSLFKIAPPAFRPIIYHRSWWIEGNEKMDEKSFMDSYAPLDFMPQLTVFDAKSPTFTLLVNETTHEPWLLQAPEYRPVEHVTNKGTSVFAEKKSYHITNAAIQRWAEFFDYLKENGVYDNTRIIIVSDHGDGTITGKFDETFKEFNKEEVTATLLFKDFDAHGEIRADNTFMTNADTPFLATKDIIPHASNPFTKNAFEVADKNSFIKIAHAPVENLRSRYNTKYKVKDNEWYTVKDDIFKNENWGRLNEK
ncbi:MAG: membrane protein insertase YidC [Treponema sp.]|nr:membrane protein insertase YidC [Treponema sp.]